MSNAELTPLEKSARNYMGNDAEMAYIHGAEWQRDQIANDLRFMQEALPNEHKIADLHLRAEIDLVRSKLNEIIAKIQ